ncbi:MAG: DUF222 domain-containing protein [Halioglobus sp.]
MNLPIPVFTGSSFESASGSTAGFSCSDEQLGREITLLSTQINIENYRLLKMIAEFDLRGGWRSDGAVRSCAHWLAAHCGMAIGPARERVRVARSLARLPKIEKVFSTGELSFSKVRAITRAATASNEEVLVELAEHTSAGHLEVLVAKYEPVDEFGLAAVLAGEFDENVGARDGGAGGAKLVEGAVGSEGAGLGAVDGSAGVDAAGVAGGIDGGAADGALKSGENSSVESSAGSSEECGAETVDEDSRREHARELFWFQDKEGMWIIHAKLPPEQGQLVVKMLEAVSRPIMEERQEEWNARKKLRLQAAARKIMRRRSKSAVVVGTDADAVDVGKVEGNSADSSKGKGGAVETVEEKVGGSGGAVAAIGNTDVVEPMAKVFGESAIGRLSDDESPIVRGVALDLESGSSGSSASDSVSGSDSESASEPVSCSVPGSDLESDSEPVSVSMSEVTASVEYQRAEEKISAETFSQFINQVRADAFEAIAEHFLATSGDYEQLKGLNGAERCQVVLHVDINTLREQRSGVCCTHGKGHFEDKPWLSPRTARRLSCDTSLVTVLEDEAGSVLNVGRRSRVVPPHIRRALLERDGVCQYPGCHESRYVDAHHIRHWADGGETSLDNLVTLCRFHHRELHRGNFEWQPLPQG